MAVLRLCKASLRFAVYSNKLQFSFKRRRDSFHQMSLIAAKLQGIFYSCLPLWILPNFRSDKVAQVLQFLI